MINKNFLKAAMLGLAVSLSALSPTTATADTVRILSGEASSPLTLTMNRAAVVESDVPFIELSIANPGIADISSLSDRTIYVLAKQPGRTTLTLLGLDGRLITNVEVHVTPDLDEFKERLTQILPGENIEVRTAGSAIVLSGTVSSLARLDRALELATRYAGDRVSNLMVVGGVQQVMLKVRFAEVRRDVTKALSSSLSFGGTGVNGDFDISGGANGGVTSGGFGGGQAQALTPSDDNAGAMVLGFGVGDIDIGIMIEALERRGVLRSLAEPNLIALSGQEAKFLAGGEYPIPVRGANSRVGIEFKQFGVELNFVPRVVDGDIINLELTAAVSSIDPSSGILIDGFAVDGFRRRETSTTVEMRDGESFAIAGLLQDDFSDSNGQVPWIGDVPILGALFRSADYQRSQTELVIIVTPHLVSPTRGEALALPTDRVRPPTEQELFLFGKVARTNAPTSGGAGEVARQDFSGSYGYVLDE